MTMKELRIAKGLNQNECARYLGMSTRSYQNYEHDPNRVNTAKYNAAYQRLSAYEKLIPAAVAVSRDVAYHTNLVMGADLQTLTDPVALYQKRDCFALLEQFIRSSADSRIAILYGLRRTGKTTLLFQMIRELPMEQTAYIKIKTGDDMSKLTKDLERLHKSGFRYIFIDEATLMDDFIGTASLLSDIFAAMGMKIVLSGTDSLGFAMAGRDELYDRSVMIHTSYIPFREYARLLGISSIDSYIEYGGTLKHENMTLSDPDAAFDEVSFRDDESTRKYIDTAISRNIQHTLKNDRFGEYFDQLRELYDKGELTNVINRIVESMNHQFLLRVVQEEFVSHDFGSAKQLLMHEYPAEIAHVLYDVDRTALIERLKALIDVKEQQETTVTVTQSHLDKIKRYLYMLDLLVDCTERYEKRGQAEYVLFAQPGMRFAIAKALVFALMQDEAFAARPEQEKNYIAEKILEDVKGRMMEDIILLETEKTAPKHKDVFRFKFEDGGEFDMVVYDRKSNSCRLYEVKHSDKIVDRQTRYLRDADRLAAVSRRFGRIDGKYVIYRGDGQTAGDIVYVNAEEYLKGL